MVLGLIYVLKFRDSVPPNYDLLHFTYNDVIPDFTLTPIHKIKYNIINSQHGLTGQLIMKFASLGFK